MESYLAKTLIKMLHIQIIQEQGHKPRRWLTFGKSLKLAQMG